MNENYDMIKLLHVCKQLYNDNFFIFYDDECIVSKGIYMTPRKKPGCSLILYRTGSVTILGGKIPSDIVQCQAIVDEIFKDCFKKKIT